MRVVTAPLSEPPPGGGNVTIRDLRRDFDELSPDQRLERAALLSRAASELAAGRPGP